MSIQERWFEGHGGRPVFYRRSVPDNLRGGVILCHGYSEHSGRYVEVIEALGALGLAVFAEDHRGHGRTSRILGDIESVPAVIADLHLLRQKMDELIGPLPLFFFGHSMGALLTLRYLQKHRGGAGAILNGPAIRVPPNIPRVAMIAARFLADHAPHVAIQGFFDPERASRDPEVWKQMRCDPLRYKGRIRARTGREILDALGRTVPRLAEIDLPVLITHGTHDQTVMPTMSTVLFEAISSTDKTQHLFEGLRHEVHQEPEKREVIAIWTDWIAERLAG